jgi:hypothetical protein
MLHITNEADQQIPAAVGRRGQNDERDFCVDVMPQSLNAFVISSICPAVRFNPARSIIGFRVAFNAAVLAR